MTKEELKQELFELISRARHSTYTTDEIIDRGLNMIDRHVKEVLSKENE